MQKTLIGLLVLVLVTLAATSATVSPAAAQSGGGSGIYFIIDGIPGDSTVKGFEKSVVVDSYAFSVVAKNAKPTFKDLTVTKGADPASSKLLEAALAGKRIKSAKLVVRRGGDDVQRFELTDLGVTSFESTSRADGVPVESVTFNYGTVEVEYLSADKTGAVKSVGKTGWDVRANKAL